MPFLLSFFFLLKRTILQAGLVSACKQPLARVASQGTDSCGQTGDRSHVGAEMWQQDLLPAGCGVDTDSCSQTRTGAIGAEMWQQDLLARQIVEARLRLGLPLSLCFVVVFFFCFFASLLLVACSAKNHHSMQSEGCDFPLSFSLHAASLPVYCSESRPVSPCHDHCWPSFLLSLLPDT